MPDNKPTYEFVAVQPNEEMPEKWYYITRRESSEILFYFDLDGSPVWKPNNFQEFFPFVFSNPREAERVCDLVNGDAVQAHEFRVTNGNRSVPW